MAIAICLYYVAPSQLHKKDLAECFHLKHSAVQEIKDNDFFFLVESNLEKV